MLGFLLWMTCTPGTRLHLKRSQASLSVLLGLDLHTSVTHTLMRALFWGDSSQSSCSKARTRSQHADKITTSHSLGSLLVMTLTPGTRLSLESQACRLVWPDPDITCHSCPYIGRPQTLIAAANIPLKAATVLLSI